MRLGDLVPTVCAACGRSGQVLCLECSRWILGLRPPSTRTPLDGRLVALGPLEGRFRDVVHALKYRGVTELAVTLGSLLEERCRGRLDVEDIRAVAPVPTSSRRRRRRGYDQADLLARALATRLGVPHVSLLSRQQVGRRPQTDLDARERRALPRDVFLLGRVPPDNVMMVDDVVTTGATMLAALRCVEGAGSAAVCASLAVTPAGR